MAEGYVSVTEGAGKNLHTNTRTVSSVLVAEQVVLDGEPHTASYTTSVGPVSATTANSHIIQIMAGSSSNVRVRRIEVYQSAAASTATLAAFGLYRLSTAGTGGTVGSVVKLDAADAGAGATTMTLPSSKGTEGDVLWAGVAYFIQTVGASTPFVQPILTLDFDAPRSKPVIIAAGTSNGVALKLMTAMTSATVYATVWLDETSY